MKNKLKYLILIILISNNFYFSYAEEVKFDDIKFEATKIEYFNQDDLKVVRI